MSTWYDEAPAGPPRPVTLVRLPAPEAADETPAQGFGRHHGQGGTTT